MISLSAVTVRRAAKVLFTNADLTIYHGQKIGIVGHNGSGKSSLLALLRGELQADAGSFEKPNWLRFSSVAQETPASTQTAVDYVQDGDKVLRAWEAKLIEAEANHEDMLMADCYLGLAECDAYTAGARAAKILDGLGFTQEKMQTPVAAFSGGWRMRLNLAQALFAPSDVLLLDEPTNHLDLETVAWLEDWLKYYAGTLVLISHDRDFLDETVSHIVSVENQQLTLYSGNYSAFERQRAAQLAQQQALHEKQQTQREHLEKYINRFRAQATKARQAQSRIKALEKMEWVAAAQVDSPYQISFASNICQSNPLLSLDNASAGYTDKPIIADIRFSIQSQDRIGLLGLNGAGKTTFIKLLAGEIPVLSGDLVLGNGLKIGYFAQQQLEQLDADASPLLHLRRISPNTREQELLGFLGRFMFQGTMATGPIGHFSGGEKSRLALALLIWQKPNLLLLDEPTNHLDLAMRDALSIALQTFEGAMILISHDRHLLRSTVDQFYLVENGKVAEFEGDLDDYQRYRTQQRRALVNEGKALSAAPVVATPVPVVAVKVRNPIDVKQRKTMQQNIAKLDRELASLLAEHQTLSLKIVEVSTVYQSDKQDWLQTATLTQKQLENRMQKTEEEWLQLTEQLDAMGAA